MMDVDGFGFGNEDSCCGACGKTVCFSCSITNLGENKRCLACAGGKSSGSSNNGRVWVGGIGWTNASGVVC